ncbi:MAG: rRNA maturation RNase YbeY [Anaerolineae bacterium]
MAEIQVTPQVSVDAALLEVVTRAASAAIRAAGESSDDLGLTIVLTDDAELARLNEQFRGVEGPTDVLSFESDDGYPEEIEEMQGYLGDVVISVERAAAQAAAGGHSLAEELALLAAHGALHLLGYDHAEEEERREMWMLQDQAAADATQ